jgi:hypothetical protein
MREGQVQAPSRMGMRVGRVPVVYWDRLRWWYRVRHGFEADIERRGRSCFHWSSTEIREGEWIRG